MRNYLFYTIGQENFENLGKGVDSSLLNERIKII